ncbi:hypothetical protein GOA61_18110 [Sinorhizobium meliloti]|nr:hypothetical protein [Sinorhizobium meliloti]MDW9877665.1 hypothetical protein [Sinorhizobium meliloti]
MKHDMTNFRLGDVASVFAGAGVSRTEKAGLDGVAFPVIGVRHLNDGAVAPREELDEIAFPYESRALPYEVHVGDVLVTGRGTVLKFGIVGAETEGAIASGNIIIIRPQTQALGGTLFAILSSGVFRPKIEVMQRGATTLLSLSPKDLAKLEITLPSREKQELISAFVRESQAAYLTAIQAAEARRVLARGILNTRLFGDHKKD